MLVRVLRLSLSSLSFLSATEQVSRLREQFHIIIAPYVHPSPNHIRHLDSLFCLFSLHVFHKFYPIWSFHLTQNQVTGSRPRYEVTKGIIKMHKELMDDGFYLGDPSILDQVSWVHDGRADRLAVKRELVRAHDAPV